MTAQLLDGLSQLTDISGVLVAYEPVWAIGTGQAATPEVAQQMSSALRHALRGPVRDSSRPGALSVRRKRERSQHRLNSWIRPTLMAHLSAEPVSKPIPLLLL